MVVRSVVVPRGRVRRIAAFSRRSSAHLIPPRPAGGHGVARKPPDGRSGADALRRGQL